LIITAGVKYNAEVWSLWGESRPTAQNNV